MRATLAPDFCSDHAENHNHHLSRLTRPEQTLADRDLARLHRLDEGGRATCHHLLGLPVGLGIAEPGATSRNGAGLFALVSFRKILRIHFRCMLVRSAPSREPLLDGLADLDALGEGERLVLLVLVPLGHEKVVAGSCARSIALVEIANATV